MKNKAYIHKTIKREKRPETSKGKNISVEMKKKNVGMTIARKSKETKVGMKDGNGINLCSANSPSYTHYYLKLPDVYIGIVQNKD